MRHADTAPQTLQETIRFFSDPDTCLNFMADLRWPDGVTCPRCNGKEVGFTKTRRVWKCKKCKDKQFSIKRGTIFEDSPLSLDKWLCAIWMIVDSKNEVSSGEVHRALGVTQKTAGFMLHRIRNAMKTVTFQELSRDVTGDRTYLSSIIKNVRKGQIAFEELTTSFLSQ